VSYQLKKLYEGSVLLKDWDENYGSARAEDNNAVKPAAAEGVALFLHPVSCFFAVKVND
jgi:hypothetical protein